MRAGVLADYSLSNRVYYTVKADPPPSGEVSVCVWGGCVGVTETHTHGQTDGDRIQITVMARHSLCPNIAKQQPPTGFTENLYVTMVSPTAIRLMMYYCMYAYYNC